MPLEIFHLRLIHSRNANGSVPIKGYRIRKTSGDGIAQSKTNTKDNPFIAEYSKALNILNDYDHQLRQHDDFYCNSAIATQPPAEDKAVTIVYIFSCRR